MECLMSVIISTGDGCVLFSKGSVMSLLGDDWTFSLLSLGQPAHFLVLSLI